jgi:hypothetical protein
MMNATTRIQKPALAPVTAADAAAAIDYLRKLDAWTNSAAV